MQTEEQREKWLSDRLKCLGASEVSSIMKYECKEDLEKYLGGFAKDFIEDKDFKSAFCTYHYKKQNATPPKFSETISKFGHNAEKFAEMDLNKMPFMKAECQPQQVIFCPEFHKLAGFTPDLFNEFQEDCEFNSKTTIKYFHPKGKSIFPKKEDMAVVEVKTINRIAFCKDNKGVEYGREEPKSKYIVQAQDEGILMSSKDKRFKWSIVVYIVPNESGVDNDFGKGEANILFNNLHIKDLKAYEKLKERYSVYIWIYPLYKSVSTVLKMTFDKWEERLQNCSEPKMDYENVNDVKIANKEIKSSKIFKKYFEELKIKAQTKFGTDESGIIKLTPQLQKKYQDLYDMLQIDKCNREVASATKKTIDETKSRLLDFCLKEKAIGFDTDKATFHLGRSGGGFTIKSNFKTLDETMQGKVKVKDEVKPEIGIENFI